MRRWRGGHVAGAALVGLLVGGAIGYAANGGDDSTTSQTTEATTPASSEAPARSTTTTTVLSTTSTVTTVPPTTQRATTTTVAASSSAGTRAQPVPVGSPVTISSKEADWTIKVVAVEPDASAAIMKLNSFNKAAPAGTRYVLVTVEATYNGPKDSSRPLVDLTLKAIDSSNVETKECGDYGAYAFGNNDSSKEVFQKGTVQLKECFAPAEGVAESLVMIASASFSTSNNRAFMALR